MPFPLNAGWRRRDADDQYTQHPINAMFDKWILLILLTETLII
jgi:hypothetical protein